MFVWLLPIVSGLAEAGFRTIIKTTNVPSFALNGIGFLSALPFYIVWLFYTGVPEIQTPFWFAIAGHVPLLILAFTLMVAAHRISPLILTVPYLSLTPAFLLITSPLMGGGTPAFWGIIGVLLITFGVYVLNTKEKQRDLLEPFRQLKNERGSKLMFVVGIIFAITANFDYIAFTNANAPMYLVIDHGLVGIICLLIAVFLSAAKIHGGAYAIKSSYIVPAILFGATLAISVIPHMLAFEWIPNVPYVIAGKRAGSILFTIIIGLVLACMSQFGGRYAEEKSHLRYRIPGALTMTFGMILIIFYGQ